MAVDALVDALRAVVGESHVLVDGDLCAYVVDWRRRWRGAARAVVLPASTDEVAAVVRACVAHGAAIVPQGGNTGLVGGGVPDESGTQVLLSLKRMQRVRAIDTANLTLTADAGCVLQTLQEAARAQGLLLPLSLAAEGSCTLGGNLATNAGGTQVLRFGNARDLCLGLEVVTPQGDVWHGLSGLRKDNTGYDLRDLYVGSEGTLGVITAATMKLYPSPTASMTAMAACSTLPQCVALLGLAQAALGAALEGFEIMNALSLELVARHMPQLRQPLDGVPWAVLIEMSDTEGAGHARTRLEGLLEAALERGVIFDAAVAETIAHSHVMWHLREAIPLAQAQEGSNIKHDISLPVSRIAAFCDEAGAALSRALPGSRLVNFGHLGDGNLHYNVQSPEGADAAAFLRHHEDEANRIVYDAVAAHGGSISAEHGIGALKVRELEERKDATALALMRTIKRALDPAGTMNPGRVLID
jgi:FAD/FMN-containing dehydrogenase